MQRTPRTFLAFLWPGRGGSQGFGCGGGVATLGLIKYCGGTFSGYRYLKTVHWSVNGPTSDQWKKMGKT